MASKEELVDQVKNLQRGDPGAKAAWQEFCQEHLGGVKDPNRHDEGTLAEFLQSYARGGLPPAARKPIGGGRPMGGKGGYGPPPQSYRAAPPPVYRAPPPSYRSPAFAPPAAAYGGSFPPLADFVKTGQRQSQNWKSAWQIYCAIYGNGLNDPSRHDDNFVKGFIDYVGELAVNGLSALADQEGISLDQGAGPGMKRGPAGGFGGGPPAKRMKGGGKGGGKFPESQDNSPEKQALVDRIKAMQRTDPSLKDAWWAYCDAECKGVKDPNRHEIDTLEAFLATC